MLASIQDEQSTPFTGLHGNAVIRISGRIPVCIGIARWPLHGADSDALIQAEDRAVERCNHSDDAQAVMAASCTAASAG